MAVVFTNQQSRAAYKTAHLNNTEGVDPLADNTSNDISAEKLRQAIADLRNSATFRKDDQYVRYTLPAAVGGTVDAITISISDDYPTTYTNKIPVRFKATGASTADVTVNINSIGVLPAYKEDGTRISAGDLRADGTYEIVYDAAADGGSTAGIVFLRGYGDLGNNALQITGTTATVSSAVDLYVFTGSSNCTVTLPAGTGTLIARKFTFINMSTTATVTINDAGGETLKASDPFVLYPETAYDFYYTGITGYEWCFV